MLSLLLAACAGGPALPPARPVAELAPAQWQAPLPHGGQPAQLARWWQSFDDPALARVVEAAQAASPTVAQARSRIAAAQVQRTGANATLLPRLDGTVSATRGISDPVTFQAPATTVQAGLQASWEADVFGRLRDDRSAADERLLGARAGWHEARVSVAAEAATSWFSLRTCGAIEQVAAADAASRAETARLTRLAADAGFQAPATAALAEASAAQGRMQLEQQRARCTSERKALVALTGIAEDTLAAWARDTHALPAPPNLEALPARVLAQRPDVYSAERNLLAAAADVGSADASRFPRLTLTGNVSRARFSSGSVDMTLNTWSLGPLAVTLPIFDGGVIAANRDAARVRYDEALLAYQARVRQAVREIEEALVNLESTRLREADAQRAVQGFRASLAAAESRWRTGLGSLIELEDQRRQALAAQNALVLLQQERAAALVALYRAAGGGWPPDDALATAPIPETR
ncbi:efflux transporter outer membrane subunit [Ramlibacter sp. CrO1]|uniref:Efflux transporter outer membrane subunit n=2 Tax=Ramlibacter algicola TaxID=2795217 RepID=A0A934UP85_9BURK|nr:efflux transporter outer membrane subunit [Ramlibacter algicola]